MKESSDNSSQYHNYTSGPSAERTPSYSRERQEDKKTNLTNFFYYEKKKTSDSSGPNDAKSNSKQDGYYDYSAVGSSLWSEDAAKKKETVNPSYFRFPMVF